MILQRQEVYEFIDSMGWPSGLKEIWGGKLPSRLAHTLQNPSSLFDAFVLHPEGFPNPDELVILWQTNGSSITGFLKGSGEFIQNFLEDGPEDFEVLGTTLHQAVSPIFGSLLSRNVAEDHIDECAAFLEFNYVEELRRFISREEDWEDLCGDFIASLEK